jgi:hypothetical protein
MRAMIVVVFLLAVAFAVMGCLDQRKLWYATQEWRFQNPAANEPSDAALAVGRVSCFVAAAVLAVFGFVGINLDAEARELNAGPDEDEVRAIVAEATEDLDGSSSEDYGDDGDGRFEQEARQAVRLAADGSTEYHMSVRHTGGERYTVTGDGGDHPFCIAVDSAPAAEQPYQNLDINVLILSARCPRARAEYPKC